MVGNYLERLPVASTLLNHARLLIAHRFLLDVDDAKRRKEDR